MRSERSFTNGLQIREFCAKDAAAVAAILSEAKEAAGWSERTLRESLGSNGMTAFLSETAGRISGFIIGRQIADEAEILNLVVRKEYRRQGTGRALVNRLFGRFLGEGVSRVFLEVRASNSRAISFYQDLGFVATGKRKDYYQAPPEAAVLMEKRLKKSTD